MSTSTLGQRALGALRLTRSFLLLEDDYDIDWEVDQDERPVANHPHRAPLRGRSSPRRAGQAAPRPQVCLCPIGDNVPRREPKPFACDRHASGAPSATRSACSPD